MSTHTKGPWESEGNTVYPQREIPGVIATAFSRKSDEETSANALLISAAPELLEACKAMIACTGGSENWDGETKIALTMIEAAIAKAEGESQPSAG